MKKYLKISLFFVIAICNCSFHQTSHRELYQEAIKNSILPDSSKIFYNLTEINNQNENIIWRTINNEQYLLVVSWVKSSSYYFIKDEYGFYNTGDYDIWVTVVPELKNLILIENPIDLKLRLKQMLGLPPNGIYQYFVEFWVRPDDLFRPCPDAEIDDNHCELCFHENTDSTYIVWINENRNSSYYNCDLYDKYPWTQLGYTYDWSPKNKTHFGPSEFVIKQKSKVLVKKIYTTENYLR